MRCPLRGAASLASRGMLRQREFTCDGTAALSDAVMSCGAVQIRGTAATDTCTSVWQILEMCVSKLADVLTGDEAEVRSL